MSLIPKNVVDRMRVVCDIPQVQVTSVLCVSPGVCVY